MHSCGGTDHRHLHGAALVDEQGRETPITESMVEEALIRLLADEIIHRTPYLPVQGECREEEGLRLPG